MIWRRERKHVERILQVCEFTSFANKYRTVDAYPKEKKEKKKKKSRLGIGLRLLLGPREELGRNACSSLRRRFQRSLDTRSERSNPAPG